ncbi:MAG: restriction endonuclease [Rhodopseudomonas sp.]|uniref:restriction endonuclease n=1 Tax=Rhodopseudomonas sp. TaxID=1078 RepID=UPI0017F44964|nr:restriction endonuclease [Rhodopseudomonas sp.]NVN86438.1 restriction endonuclease [Rhodopseudomonas sp.]
MAFPSFHTFFVPVVHALRSRGGSATIDELEEAVAIESGLSDEERAQPHGDGPRTEFSYRLAWARTYLKKGGALDNSERGVWHLTPAGYEMSDEQINEIKYQVQQQNRQARIAAIVDTEPDDEQDEEGIAEVDLSWKERLLEILLRIEPSTFERLCQRVLRESGFVKVEVTGRSGDGGIDGTGVLRLNLLSFQVLFQSKRYRGSVGSSTVRDFRGAMVGRADKGLIITTGTFTADARKEATRDGAPAIDLVDGDALCDLLKSLRIGVRIEVIESIIVDPDSFASL